MWFRTRAFINSPEHIAAIAKTAKEAGTVTEFEIFDTGDIHLAKQMMIEGTVTAGFFQLVMGVNYGFDRVRFVTPVSTGSRVRGRFTLRELTKRSATDIQMRTAVAVEIEGSDRPALVADWIILHVLPDPAVRSQGEPA